MTTTGYFIVMEPILSATEFNRLVQNERALDELSVAFDQRYIIVDTNRASSDPVSDPVGINATNRQPQCPVIALAANDVKQPAFVDVVAQCEEDLVLLTSAIDNNPLAATLLVQLLRHNEHSTVEQGLYAESLSYSCLQHSDDFKQWLATRPQPDSDNASNESPLIIQRDASQLNITLNRASKHNAYNAALRDALYEALMLAASDNSIVTTMIRGAGPSFCAGGDLQEFGAARDAAAAHAARTTRSTALLLDRLSLTTQFVVHGACIGAGIELSAFSRSISAHRDSFFQLPEVAMGLIPGAGGTVSISNRIGRQRTAFMAISNKKIDAEQALNWGLINRIHD